MRSHSGLGRISFSIIVTAVLAAALALPAVAIGAGPKITFGGEWNGLQLGGACINGHAPDDAALHLVWKSSAGTVKANTWLATNDWGDWGYCSDDGDALAAGDLLKGTVGATTRKFTVPLVSLKIDRVADVFRGRAPAGTSVDVSYMLRGCCWDNDESFTITADENGKWLFDSEFEFGLAGTEGFDASVKWSSPKGDYVSDLSRAAEVTVRINRSTVTGYGEPFADWRLALWDTVSGLRKGVATGVVDEWGNLSGVFLDPVGHPVNVLPGDKVVGRSLASDLKFIVHDIQASADVATDIVTGTGGNTDGGGVIAVHRNGNEIGWAGIYPIDAQGNFTVDFGEEPDLGYDPANIRHGDRLLVTCGTAKGDFVVKGIPVP